MSEAVHDPNHAHARAVESPIPNLRPHLDLLLLVSLLRQLLSMSRTAKGNVMRWEEAAVELEVFLGDGDEARATIPIVTRNTEAEARLRTPSIARDLSPKRLLELRRLLVSLSTLETSHAGGVANDRSHESGREQRLPEPVWLEQQ